MPSQPSSASGSEIKQRTPVVWSHGLETSAVLRDQARPVVRTPHHTAWYQNVSSVRVAYWHASCPQSQRRFASRRLLGGKS